MNCPACGNDDTKVYKTVNDPEGQFVRRNRKCKSCGFGFVSFECYEPADVEMAFDVADARRELTKALGWLQNPARHMPLVRDTRKLIQKVLDMLQDKATYSPESALDTK